MTKEQSKKLLSILKIQKDILKRFREKLDIVAPIERDYFNEKFDSLDNNLKELEETFKL